MKEKDKHFFREMVWNAMLETGAARSKQVHDRIPDFYGNEEAANLVFSLPAWQNAKAVKSNPDRPQNRYARGLWRKEMCSTWPCPGCVASSALSS